MFWPSLPFRDLWSPAPPLVEQPTRLSDMLTAEEFLTVSLPLDAGRSELVRGELRVSPADGGAHGGAAANLGFVLAAFVRQHGLGVVFAGGVGYQLLQLPRTVRVPDASFVRADQLPSDGMGPGFLRLTPDLAIEVLAPSDTESEIEEKLEDYLISGTRLIWVVDPMRRTVMIVTPDAPVRWLREGDTLDGASVIPGFSCAVAEIFEGIARTATASA